MTTESLAMKVLRATPKRKVVLTPWLLLLPALAIFGGLFIMPLLNMLVISFSRGEQASVIVRELTVGNYTKFLTDEFYLGVLAKTLKIALMTTVSCLVIGYPVAYYLVRTRGRKRAYLTLLILGPLLINVVARTYGWLVVLGPQGLVNSSLKGVGLIRESIPLLYTDTATIIGLVHVLMAFMVLALAAALQNIDPALVLAAQNLGANRFQAFVRITLPLSLPGITAGSVILFALSTSAFITPALLGGPQNKVMSYLVYQQATFLLNWSLGGAIAFILFFITASLIFFYIKILESGRFGMVFRG